MNRSDNKITLTLPNGLTLSGTSEQVTETIKRLGYDNITNDGIHYLSKSKGLIRIADMDARHARNAALKMYRAWVESLSVMTDIDLVRALSGGYGDKTFSALLIHFARLTTRGE